MYRKYELFLNNINRNNIKETNFKNNKDYNSILEHVSVEHGYEYLKLIESEFGDIELSHIIEFARMNDNYGGTIKVEFVSKNGTIVECSPTSLRYIYHALLILTDYKKTILEGINIPIVEVGCGYGGLFLSINYFSKILGVDIKKYYLIDIDIVGNLIKLYLEINKEMIHIDYEILSASLYGSDINESELYFISNYCFTEIDEGNRQSYINLLLNRCIHGFITWQTVFGYTLDYAFHILRKIPKIEEEKPQTSYTDKNYFVRF
jgi:hypothetical protein